MYRDNDTQKSLVDLASHHQLPRFQYMDETTCEWIAEQDPNYTIDHLPDISDLSDWLSSLAISPEWFLEPKLLDSLHGLRHLWRSAFMSLYLAKAIDLDKKQTKLAVMAALLHDIRREDDKGDEGHAIRSAAWFRKNATMIARAWNTKFTSDDIVAIETAIVLHETPYNKFTGKQQALYDQYSTLVDIIKTADALDRYRLPKLKWWPNDKYLQLVPSPSLKQLSFEVVVSSERAFLQSGKSYRSVIWAIDVLETRYTSNIPLNDWAKAHIAYSS